MMKRKDGQEFQVIQAVIDNAPGTCKECGIRPRANGSSRCEKCSTSFKKRNGN